MTRPPSRTILAVALAALGLGACTVRDPARTSATGPRYASLDANLSATHDGRSAEPAPRAATPVAVLPAWIGRPMRLRERDEADAFEQIISLASGPQPEASENAVMLRVARTRGGEADGATPSGRPSEAGIRAELDATFPGMPMRVVTRPASNAYGPYGLAVGRSPRGSRCLYAWQWIEEAPALDATASRPVSLRVRLCRGDLTLEAMAAAMNQIKLVPRFEGNPVMGATAARSRPAARPYGRVAAGSGHAGEPLAEPAPPVERAAMPAPEPAAPPPGAPPGRRYLGVIDSPAASQPALPALTAAGPAGLRGVYVGAGPVAGSGTLAADLPPEALRGPPARPSGRL